MIQWCVETVIIHIFFSSRRRHTRYWRDWSSDVCSSDLKAIASSRFTGRQTGSRRPGARYKLIASSCLTVLCLLVLVLKIGRASCRGKSVDLGGRRIIKKNMQYTHLTLPFYITNLMSQHL